MEVYNIPEHGHADAYMIQGTESSPHFTSSHMEQFEGMYNEGAPEFAVQQGLYYPTPTNYGYIFTGIESPSDWDDHQRIFGLDGQEIQYTGSQTENFPYLYYTPSFGYSQSPYNPYNPYIPGAMIGIDGSYIGSQQYYNIPMYENDVSSGYYPMAVESRPDIPQNSTPEPFIDAAAYFNNRADGLGLKHNFSPASATFTLNPSRVASDLTHSFARGSDGSKINGRPSKQPVTNVSVPSSGYSNASVSNIFQARGIQVIDNASRENVWSNRNQFKVDPPSNGLSSFVSSAQGRTLMDKARTKYNVGEATKDVNGSPNASSEQNRGPRTNKLINQLAVKAYTSRAGDSDAQGNIIIHTDQYNREDFPVDYVNAKFFVIKSYSEDDVHKSIKYNVWSSTPNGNKKLNIVHADAQRIAGEESKGCPIFLFFSVNASGQFCGVAEMTGPLDFHKDMDFWQQDKWCGSFPVKWHIIKDVPNPSLRHIILENNENKPVTNSRDTQEIRYKKGFEMLKIFKHYVSKTSLLDDFVYYENRQKLLQAEKGRLLIKSFENPFIMPQIEPPRKLNGVLNLTPNDEKSKKLNNESSSNQSVSIPTEQDLVDKEIKASAANENGTSVADDDREEEESGMLRIGSLSINPKNAGMNPVNGSTANACAHVPATETANTKAVDVFTVGSVPVKVNGSAKSAAFLTFGTISSDPRALVVDGVGLSTKDASRKV